MPEEICLWESQFNISNINISKEFKTFLDKNYYFLIKDNKVKFPCYTKFDKSINRQFLYDDSIKETVAKDAKNLAMRLFMQIPPRRVMFTFIDPVSLGASFAMFTRLVDLDDRTSEVINGKIWSSSKDIEDKLKIMTDHISNVTQKCLQDKYEKLAHFSVGAVLQAAAVPPVSDTARCQSAGFPAPMVPPLGEPDAVPPVPPVHTFCAPVDFSLHE